MQIIDLSHSIQPDMPMYPGTESPLFETAGAIESNGFAEKKITLFSHTGTHIDAPAHIIPGSFTLDNMEITRFYGPAAVIDVSTISNAIISMDHLKIYQQRLKDVEFVLFFSGWDKHWGQSRYFCGFPTLNEEAAEWLASFPLKGIGIDMISFDPVDSKKMTNHKILLGNELILIENLTNLELLLRQNFQFACFPLKISDADGSPTRAVAFLTSSQ